MQRRKAIVPFFEIRQPSINTNPEQREGGEKKRNKNKFPLGGLFVGDVIVSKSGVKSRVMKRTHSQDARIYYNVEITRKGEKNVERESITQEQLTEERENIEEIIGFETLEENWQKPRTIDDWQLLYTRLVGDHVSFIELFSDDLKKLFTHDEFWELLSENIPGDYTNVDEDNRKYYESIKSVNQKIRDSR